jgi:hypothetical protein
MVVVAKTLTVLYTAVTTLFSFDEAALPVFFALALFYEISIFNRHLPA